MRKAAKSLTTVLGAWLRIVRFTALGVDGAARPIMRIRILRTLSELSDSMAAVTDATALAQLGSLTKQKLLDFHKVYLQKELATKQVILKT